MKEIYECERDWMLGVQPQKHNLTKWVSIGFPHLVLRSNLMDIL